MEAGLRERSLVRISGCQTSEEKEAIEKEEEKGAVHTPDGSPQTRLWFLPDLGHLHTRTHKQNKFCDTYAPLLMFSFLFYFHKLLVTTPQMEFVTLKSFTRASLTDAEIEARPRGGEVAR